MITDLSLNTQAILLLTAPLITGAGASPPDALTPGEYKRLARHLHEKRCQPADLLGSDGPDIVHGCQPVIDSARMQRLLGRGFLLSQVMNSFQTRAIWVVSRADAHYPSYIKKRLRDNAPAVLYGCGDITLLETGGLAVVGSRHVDSSLSAYAMNIGALAAYAESTLISGGARGIDQASMRGALESGGRVVGVLADSLLKQAMNREHRNLIRDGQLTLLSPYDPNANFNVGHAMQRNKLIYALSNAALVVSTDIDKGGTWTGAVEQLDKYKFTPVYVRSTGASSPGLEALRKRGALPWPNPQQAKDLSAVFDVELPGVDTQAQAELPLFSCDNSTGIATIVRETPEPFTTKERSGSGPSSIGTRNHEPGTNGPVEHAPPSPNADRKGPNKRDHPPPSDVTSDMADDLFVVVRQLMLKLLCSPMKDKDIAAALGLSTPQARTWLTRLIKEGSVSKLTGPVRYIAQKSTPQKHRK